VFGHLEPAKAFIAPPIAGDADLRTPQIYVWITGYQERRLTAGGSPRGAGLKHGQHKVDLFAFFIDAIDADDADTAFPVFVDGLMDAFRRVPIPLDVTDQVTGITTGLIMIGEDFEVRNDAVRSLADQRYVRYLTQVTVEVYESLNG
jgi:hypothetical protein